MKTKQLQQVLNGLMARYKERVPDVKAVIKAMIEEERNGFVLNNAGGKYKQSPDGLLFQSATVAKMIDAEFAQGKVYRIAGSYVEFAERKVLPVFSNLDASEIKREHRREGFEAKNRSEEHTSELQSQ